MNESIDLILLDEVNCRLTPLPANIFRLIDNATKVFIPHARFSPQYKMGMWNGYKSFINPGGYTYINLLDKIVPILQKQQYRINVIDQRFYSKVKFTFNPIDNEFFADHKWPSTHKLANQPVILEQHQVTFVNAALANIQGVINACTGAGKTLGILALCKKVQKYGRSLILLPSSDLVLQTAETFKDFGMDVGILMGKEYREVNKPVVIATWQTLMYTESTAKGKSKGAHEINQKDELISQHELEDLLDNLVCLISDECHTLSGNEVFNQVTKMFCSVPIRWGLTGTIPKDECNAVRLKIAVGPTVCKITSSELRNNGFLANSNITILELEDHFKPTKGLSVAEMTNSTKAWAKERSYLSTDLDRLKFIADMIKNINQTGNTLVYVTTINTGKQLLEYLSDEDAVFLSGVVNKNKRAKEYKSIRTSSNKIIIATINIAAAGIDMPRIFNLVFVDIGKGYTRVVQGIGRGLRTAEDKESVNIYDIYSNIGSSKKHINERIKFYKEEKHPFKIIKVQESEWRKK